MRHCGEQAKKDRFCSQVVYSLVDKKLRQHTHTALCWNFFVFLRILMVRAELASWSWCLEGFLPLSPPPRHCFPLIWFLYRRGDMCPFFHWWLQILSEKGNTLVKWAVFQRLYPPNDSRDKMEVIALIFKSQRNLTFPFLSQRKLQFNNLCIEWITLLGWNCEIQHEWGFS